MKRKIISVIVKTLFIMCICVYLVSCENLPAGDTCNSPYVVKSIQEYDRSRKLCQYNLEIGNEYLNYGGFRGRKLIPAKGLHFSATSDLHYFDNYDECVNYFNALIDDGTNQYQAKLEQMQAKLREMLKKKIK